MTKMEDGDSNHLLLLRLSACTSLSDLTQVLDTNTLDPVTIVQTAPERLEVNGLVDVLEGLVANNKALLASEQWVSACISRAEAIDLWTGRLDNAKEWLEAIQSLTSKEQVGRIKRTLRNVTLLDHLFNEFKDDSRVLSSSLKSLRDVDGMSSLEFVSWVMQLVIQWPHLVDILDLICGHVNDGNDDVRVAWNGWWKQNLLAASAGLMTNLLEFYPQSFDPCVVLVAVYSIGGPCSELEGARAASSMLAKALGVTRASETVQLPNELYDLLMDPSAHVLVGTIGGLADEQLAFLASNAAILVECLGILHEFGFHVDVPTIVACQESIDDQHRLLLKLLSSAHRSTSSSSLWESLLKLHDVCVFSEYSVDQIKQEYLRSLLGNEQFDQARDLIDASPSFVDNEMVVKIICEATQEFFDNADSGNMHSGLMKAAKSCLDVLPTNLAHYDTHGLVKRESTLIDAAHLVYSLQSSGLSLLSSRSSAKGMLKEGGGEVFPMEIRLASDPYSLIRVILERYTGAYKKPRIVREIAGKLQEATRFEKDSLPLSPSLSGTTADGRRALGIISVSDAFVVALLLDSATAAGDYAAAYDFAKQLINARSVLTCVLRTTEEYRSSLLLADNSADSERPVEVRTVEQVWSSCVRLATEWYDTSASSRATVADKRLEIISLALSLCPTDRISELLQLWNNVQASNLKDGAGNMQLPPWMAREPADASSQQSRGLSYTVQEALVGHRLLAKDEKGQRHAAPEEAIDPETMRTFDPAIIKRCLRLVAATAAGSEDTADNGSELRCRLLMEWLDFALTTAKEPSSDAALTFRRKVEADIVSKYPKPALDLLATKVFPQLDQTNYIALEAFYSFYARCLEGCGNAEDAEQARLRVETIKNIQQMPSLNSANFSDLVAGLAKPKGQVRQALGAALNANTLADLVALSPMLVKLHAIGSIDSAGDTSGRYSDAKALASNLCLWVLQDTLDGGVKQAAAPGDLASQFGSLLVDYLPVLEEPEDVATLAARLAFDSNTGYALGLDCRWEALRLCAEKGLDSREITLSKAYVDFIVALHSIRDPFTFARLSEDWAHKFDNASGIFAISSEDTSRTLCDKCIDILIDMIRNEVPAYFVSQAFMCTKSLCEQWDRDGETVPGLASIYTRALDNVSAETPVSDELVSRIVATVESPLELCSFDYGDDSLGSVLKQFKTEFGAVISDTVHGRRQPKQGVNMNSTAKLALLDLLDRYYPRELNSVVSEASSIDAAAATGVDISQPNYLKFQLLADKYWSIKIADGGQDKSISDRCDIWLDLLHRSDPQGATSDSQVDTLVMLLMQWSDGNGTGNKDAVECLSKCWSCLLEWAARNKRPERAVLALVKYPEQFTHDIGAQVFEKLLADAQNDPTIVASMGVLGLSYPDQTWAERCMESIIYVMLVAPTEDSMIGGQDKAGEVEDVLDLGEDEDDPWGIEDVALEGNNAGQLTEDTHADTHAAESSSPTPEQLLLAKSMILENSLLHLAVMIRGFVSACLASPPLLDTLGRTLLRSQDKIESDECQELLNTQVANARVYDISPIHELFRHTVHTVAEIGMEDVAMRWIYEFLDMPRIYRYMTSKRTVEQWLGHLDKALLGDKAAELRAREIIAKPDLEPRDLDQQVPAEASRATDADADADAVEDDLDVNVDDDAGGWGESDIDIDLDSDLNTQPVDKNPSPAADAPIDPDVSKEDNNDEAAGWGDDDDDIDLDADLENL